MSLSRSALARPFAIASIASIGLLAAACTQSGAAPNGSTASLTPGSIAVTATEFKFDPSTITTKVGKTTFAITNAGTVEHEFEIFKGDQVVDEVEHIVPGLTLELTADLAAGEYTYVCKLAGHEESGMKGALTVTE